MTMPKILGNVLIVVVFLNSFQSFTCSTIEDIDSIKKVVAYQI